MRFRLSQQQQISAIFTSNRVNSGFDDGDENKSTFKETKNFEIPDLPISIVAMSSGSGTRPRVRSQQVGENTQTSARRS